MREIEFRQKLKERYVKNNEHFHYWGFIDGGFVSPVGKNISADKGGQYTGIKDKNGVKIYEGDIVTNNYILWRIEFGDEGSFIACALDNEFNYALLSDYVFEIVGNICENPELLNETLGQ